MGLCNHTPSAHERLLKLHELPQKAKKLVALCDKTLYLLWRGVSLV